MMYATSALAILALSSFANGAPLELEARQDVPEICNKDKIDQWDPSSWHTGGGHLELRAWFQQHNVTEDNNAGEADWLQEMDRASTGDGTGNGISLDCSNINSNNCPGPRKQCREYTPYNYFYIKHMASQVNAHFKFAHEALQNFAIVDSLAIDGILKDFELEIRGLDMSKVFGIGSASFWLGGSVFGFNPAAGGVLNMLGAIFGIVGAGADLAQQIPDYGALKIGMEKHLSDVFTGTNERLERLLSRLFGRNLDDTILDEVLEQMKFSGFDPNPQGNGPSKIVQFLQTGEFMRQLDESSISNAINEGFKQMRKGLVGNLLAGLDVHVLHNSGIPESECKGGGMRWVDNACDRLYITPPGSTRAELVPEDWYDKIEKTYEIDLPLFYKNIDDCNNGNVTQTLSGAQGFPSCMFGIGVIKTGTKDKGHCFPENGDTLPESLQREKGLWEECTECSRSLPMFPGDPGRPCDRFPIWD